MAVLSVLRSRLRILLVLGAIMGLAVVAGLSMAGSPTAQAGHVSCGDTIGPWEYVSLDSDLNCDTNPALTVVGPAVLNLNGHTVHCNISTNNGVEIEGWYATVKNGLITGCQGGVPEGGVGEGGVVVGGYGYHRVRGLEITDNGTGIVVNSNRNRIEDNNVHDNNNDTGITGIQVNGSDNTLKRNISNSNRGPGFQVLGERNRLLYNSADENNGFGFSVLNNNFFWANSANGNLSTGFGTPGEFNVFLFNSAIGHTLGHGFFNNSIANNNTYKYNTALDNGTDLVDQTTDCDNNVWEFNTFGTKNQDCIN